MHFDNWASIFGETTTSIELAPEGTGYSKKFLAAHEGEILLHKAAKKYFDEQGMTKLPTIKRLQGEYAELLAKKKSAYADYRKAREEMQELVTAKANIDRILGKEAAEHEAEKEKNEQR